ncbi:MAG: SAM-dependent methyltransferase [Actinobacteria bacterium]|nr:SAM-dependent methyltransferase [Actinomycetota bacterium]
MPAVRYALLPRAGANRVYNAASLGLAAAELAFVCRELLGGRTQQLAPVVIGGVDYLGFEVPSPLADHELAIVANISTLHALFERDGDLLRPVATVPLDLWDDDILTIQRYQGKTNEQFTRLLTNVTLAAADDCFRRALCHESVRLLDPLCGRGTTLNIAVLYGLEAAGLEAQRKEYDLYREFVVRWLKDKRVKHHVEHETHRKGRDAPFRRTHIRYRAKERPDLPERSIDVVNDDTLNAMEHFKPRSIDLVVTDLPYGVQHQSTAAAGRPRRRPEALLEAALPVWFELLRAGGAIGMSWNRRTLHRDRLCELVEGAGLVIVGARDSEAFVHAVDRSITRDVLVARR